VNSLKLLLRFLIVGGLLLVLLIPLLLIRGTISGRESYRNEAIARVSESYARAQTLLGPLLVLPWSEQHWHESKDATGEITRERLTRTGHDLIPPQQLRVNGEIHPDQRRIGLFRVPVYRWDGKVRAQFVVPARDAGREYGPPYLSVGVSDVRGLIGSPALRVNGEARAPLPGSGELESLSRGLHALLPELETAAPGTRVDIALDVAIGGTRQLGIVPLGDDTEVRLKSSWPHPLFDGSFLPNERTISAEGFDAHWAISSLASIAQQQLQNADSRNYGLEVLRVSLVDPVDVYTLADRASKYGILFILLTFVGFGLFELIRHLRIHPLQYLLVGLALAIFFLLLLSLSEHLAFWQAYVIAALACIGLLGVYLSGVLRNWRYGLVFSSTLMALYAALYLLLSSEGYSLLLGSLLLFATLATIMYMTRHLDWYEAGENLR